MTSALRLLLIEDSQDDTDLLLRHLKQAAVDLQATRVDNEADLRKALTDQEWDTVICDFNMPKLTAIDAITLVRELRPDLPVIVVSGSVGEERAVETMRAGANDFITKDNMARLVPVLKRELREHAAHLERKRIESALLKSEESLRQAQRLESIGQLAGGIAHDFNNIMATVLLQSELLADGLKESMDSKSLIDYVSSGIEQIKKSTNRATNLTRQLLAFSRRQVIQPKVISLNALIQDMEKMFTRLIESNVRIQMDLAADVKNIKIDPGHLEQILINLVVNARDAMPRGGQLRVQTLNAVVDEALARECGVAPGPHVLLTISDTGMGMSEEVKKHLFEPFFTTKPVGKGTGLGLCTVYGIVKQNRGLVFVDSQLGKGTTFKLFFPTSLEEAQPVRAVAKDLSNQRGSGRILVAEDEDNFRELVSEALADYGYKVVSVANGKAALEAIQSAKEPFDLVLTDLMMPLMSGMELAKATNELGLNVKFLYQSGYTEDSLLESGGDPTQCNFLAKPYTLKVLLNEIQRILSEKRTEAV